MFAVAWGGVALARRTATEVGASRVIDATGIRLTPVPEEVVAREPQS